MSSGGGKSERRTLPRRSVIWSGTLVVGEYSFHCRVSDISLIGARVRLDLPLKRGAEVVLEIPRCQNLPAVVSYHRDGIMGLTFIDPPEQVLRCIGDTAAHTLGLDQVMARG